MSVLRNPRTTAWQAERQPRGPFGKARCAIFSPTLASMDFDTAIDAAFRFHFMPRCCQFKPKVIDFWHTNWYMWSIWKDRHATHPHHRKKHESRVVALISRQSPVAKHCRQWRPNGQSPQTMGNDGVDGDDGYWMLCCLRHGGEVQTAALHHLTRRMT